MRLIKKFIKKLYHLIWFLSAFLLFSPRVNAIVNIGGTAFEQSPQVNFYDNSGGTLTSKGAGYYSAQGYWVSNDNIITTGGSVDGANIAFTINGTFIAGYTYSLSVLIGMESSAIRGSNTRVCIAENINNAVARYQNPSSFPCINTISIVSMTGVANFDYNGYSMSYGMLTFVFTADFTSPTITFAYQTVGNNNSRHIFGGYNLQTIAQPINGLTQSQVQSIINNSGLATANSVNQVQSSINQIQTDINTSSQNIINNNNNNTTNIINNQDANTDKEIESQKVCDIYNLDNSALTSSGFLNSSGAVVSQFGGNYTSKYYPVNKGETYSLSLDFNLSSPSYCLYDSTKTLISCTPYNNNRSFSIVPSVDGFIRYSGNKTNGTTTFSGKYCKNGNQALNDSVNDLNDSITNDDAPDVDLDLDVSSDTPISDLITMPLTILNSLINTLSDTCSNYTLPFFFNTTITLPCFTISDYLGNNITNYIDLFICLYMCYEIGMLVVSIFEDITSLRDIYDSLYVPRHADTGYQPRHAKGGAN